MGLFYLLYIYLIGGVTFLPLVVFAIYIHARLTLPHVDPKAFAEDFEDPLRDAGDDDKYIKSGGAASLDERFKGKHDADLAEGYYAVCREYVPGGVNGKPPEKATGTSGDGSPEPSPSVYQSMYRSLFAQKQQPTLEPNKAAGRFSKKPRNVFYVVLRHGHLMLYDDEYQVEVRHVISLAHHKIDVFAGGNPIPEGELWIKRNAIRLIRKDSTTDTLSSTSKPFFFFSENCSDKEDFYHAMLQNQERIPGETDNPPTILHFDNEHMVSLIQKLHSSEEQFHTRWLNALISRWFLGMYKTRFIEDIIRMKITKKIARVQKPGFLTGIILRNINMGSSAPLITNPKLRDLTIDGNCAVEADLHYEGNVRVEIAAAVRIELGSRFKAREVQVVLAVTLKKLAGRGILRFKPPPSNRAWITFETKPKMELSIEPIWGSRQITYGVVLRQIENRIREVFAETLVLPFWDDIPFYNTQNLRWRGGIWTEDGQGNEPVDEIHVPDEMPQQEEDAEMALDQSAVDESEERSASLPTGLDSASKGFFSRKGHKAAPSSDSTPALSSGIERARGEKPKPIRSTSSTAAPTITTSNADPISVNHDGSSNKDAASLMREISNRSQPSSPPETPLASSLNSNRDRSRSPFSGKRPSLTSEKSSASLSSTDGTADPVATIKDYVRDQSPSASLKSRSSTQSSVSTQSKTSNKLAKLAESLTPSEAHQAQLAAISAAAASASRSWTWGSKKGKHSNSPSLSSNSGIFSHSPSNSVSSTGASTPVASSEPIGRGRPLPPPGTPLPPPERANTFAGAASSWMGGIKKKSPNGSQIPIPSANDRRSPRPDRKASSSSTGTNGSDVKRRPVPPPPLPARRVSRAGFMQQQDNPDDGNIVVVTAPLESPTPDADRIRDKHQENLIDLDEPGEHGQAGGPYDGGRSENAVGIHHPHARQEIAPAYDAAADESTEEDPRTPLADRTWSGPMSSDGTHWAQRSVAENLDTKVETGQGANFHDSPVGREDLTASELMAREGISPADLEGPG